MSQPAYPMRRWNPSIHTNHANQPHAACENCYADCTTHTRHNGLLWFLCPNCDHFQARHASAALAHATFLARYHTGPQENR